MTDAEFKFQLGDEVKDTLTDFEGVVTSQHRYLDLTRSYGVQPRALHDGRRVDVEYVGEHRLAPNDK